MNTISVIGINAHKLVDGLAVERDTTDGNTRVLRNGDVKLDSVKAWERAETSKPIEHQADGSTVEVVYGAYLKPTERQKKEAEGAKSAGVDLKFIKGRIIDVKSLENGDTVLLVTNGLRRTTKGGPPFRLLNISKGKLYGIAINGVLGKTAEEVRDLYEKSGQAPAPSAPAPAVDVPKPAPVPSGGTIELPAAPAPEKGEGDKKHKLK
jgi:hypothetical protein